MKLTEFLKHITWQSLTHYGIVQEQHIQEATLWVTGFSVLCIAKRIKQKNLLELLFTPYATGSKQSKTKQKQLNKPNKNPAQFKRVTTLRFCNAEPFIKYRKISRVLFIYLFISVLGFLFLQHLTKMAQTAGAYQ